MDLSALFALSDDAWKALGIIVDAAVVILLAWMKIGADRIARQQKKAAKESNKKLTEVAEAVEVVHNATNGMKTDLVEEVRKASFAAGEKSETDKQDQTKT